MLMQSNKENITYRLVPFTSKYNLLPIPHSFVNMYFHDLRLFCYLLSKTKFAPIFFADYLS